MNDFISEVRKGNDDLAYEIFGASAEQMPLRLEELAKNLNFCSSTLFERLSSNFDDDIVKGMIPFAIESGNLEIVKVLFDKGIKPDPDMDLMMAVDKCADKSKFSVLMYLYDVYGSDVLTAHTIYAIIKQDNLKLYKWMEDKFPNIKENNELNISFAIKNISLNIIKHLLEQNVEIDGLCHYVFYLARTEDPTIIRGRKFAEVNDIMREDMKKKQGEV